MNNNYYFTLNFTGFDTAASERQSYLRLVKGNHVFYTNTRYFQEPSIFASLKINHPLHIGTRRLSDGSFWIHWLSDGNMLLKPTSAPLKGKLLAFFVGMVVCISAGYPIDFYEPNWVMIVLGIIAVLALGGATYGLCGLSYQLAQKVHPGMSDLIAKMNEARLGDFSFCQPVWSEETDDMLPFPGKFPLPERYCFEEGEIKSLYFKKWSTYFGKLRLDYHGVELQCDATPLSFSWQVNGTRWGLAPIFYHCHPPFIASGDRIIVVHRRDNGNVEALYNNSDGGTYLKNIPFSPSDKQMSLTYKVFYGFSLVIIVIMLGFFLNDMLASGWDGWRFSTEMLDIFSLILLIVGGIIGMVELCLAVMRRLSSHVGDWLALQRALKCYVSQIRADIVIQELK